MANRKPLSKQLRFDILKRDAFTCQYCGHSAPDVKLHVDHLTPVRIGGTNDAANLITSCEGCNLGKSAGAIDALLQVRLIVRNRFAKRFHEDIRDFIAWPLLRRASKHLSPSELADLAMFHDSFGGLLSELEDLIASEECEPVK